MKKLLSAILLITACSTAATSHNFIGCNWHIPAGFQQLSDNEYRKIPANLTSACVPPTVIEQHYAVLAQLAQGIEAFLNTEHGFSVLVPQSE